MSSGVDRENSEAGVVAQLTGRVSALSLSVVTSESVWLTFLSLSLSQLSSGVDGKILRPARNELRLMASEMTVLGAPPTIRRPRRPSAATVARVVGNDTGVDGISPETQRPARDRALDGDGLIVLGVVVRASHGHVADGSFESFARAAQ